MTFLASLAGALEAARDTAEVFARTEDREAPRKARGLAAELQAMLAIG